MKNSKIINDGKSGFAKPGVNKIPWGVSFKAVVPQEEGVAVEWDRERTAILLCFRWQYTNGTEGVLELNFKLTGRKENT